MPYPDTFYTRSAIKHTNYPTLTTTVETDVCIIGAGLAGLSCALELLNKGKSVVLLESQKIAWGASGRNGGFVSSGFAGGQDIVENRLGLQSAKKVFDLSLEGIEMVRSNITELNLKDVNPSPGMLSVIRYNDPDGMKRYCDKMANSYDHHIDFLSQKDVKAHFQTERYYQGNFDSKAFHFHPLNYCLGLAEKIHARGGHLFENSEAISMELEAPIKKIKTPQGRVKAKDIVFCGGGYAGNVFDKVRRSLLPISTYVVVTEKLGNQLHDLIKTKAAILDDRLASDYYRIVDQDRLLWGGRITTRTSEPKQLAQLLKQDMVNVYPELQDVKVEMAWSGQMAYARHKMPYIGAVKPGVWACTAFGGHGMNTAPIGGRLISEAITQQSDRYKIFKAFDFQWNGGFLGPLAAQSVYLSMKAVDWWRETRSRNA
ncbi:NAD(P)/FAD-dependent oxidoreductase [Kiloniella antarctica]|uniref:NAD(P)/FAD-dependent oxidoreductase n=1 Tax=Kiloniella antarctica TaxID=1550907 RepID=A0ABW5BGZ9_9PROT